MRTTLINLLPGFLIRLFAKPYVAGDSIEKGIAKADQLWKKHGFSSTLDLLGEEVFSKKDVQENITIYLNLLEQLKGKSYTTVSLKPSALGIHINSEYCFKNLQDILEKAKQVGIAVTLDMEDHRFTDDTIHLYKSLQPYFPTFGTVLQTRLHRTLSDITNMKEKHARIRVCIGIYEEEEAIALTKKSEMKEKIVEYARILVDKNYYTEIATHDKPLLDEIAKIAKSEGWTRKQIEFQQLMGVRMLKIQKKILKNYTVRLYVPFTTNWKSAIPYLRRRMINNPSMMLYVLQNFFRR